MDLKYTDNIMEWTNKLRKAGFAMQEAGAAACTFAAQSIAGKYKVKLRTETIMMRHESFTLRAMTVYPAKYKHSTGQLRPMSGINAIVGVKQMAGGKEHYLAMLEVGADKRATGQTGGVPVPVDSARGGNRNAAVVNRMRLGRGTNYGGSIDLTRFADNPRQQFAIMNSMARRGKLKTGNYYAVDQGTKKWLYKIDRGKALITRDISEDIVKIKANPMFEASVDTLSSADMETYFSRAAIILMGTLE